MQKQEHFGEWWDLSDPDNRWPGTLCIDPDAGAVLTVLDRPDGQPFLTRLRAHDVILGETTQGRELTLLRCFDRRVQGAEREIFANAALVGFHVDAADPKVSCASAVLTHASVWWGQAGIRVDPGEGFPEYADIHYRRPKTARLFKDDDLEVTVGSVLASRCLRLRSSSSPWSISVT